ncbi:MAG: hypothetical protein GC164_10060 [Phycisphaera sp.]|nr:hypothetical protein [Phycisphaera sp.]
MDSGLEQWVPLAASATAGGAVLLLGVSIARSTKAIRRSVAYSMTAAQRAAARRAAMESSPLFRLALPMVEAVGSQLALLPIKGVREYMDAPYERAGRPGGLSTDELLAMSLLIGLTLSAMFFVSISLTGSPALIPLSVIGLPAGLLLVNASLQNRIELREKQALRAMPYALDLLVLCLRSGISLTLALRKLVEDYENHPLGQELGRVLTEMDMGRPRRPAFEGLAERLPLDDIRSLCDTVIQSEELGWPLSTALEQLADRLVTERSLKGEATAGAAGVLIMMPSTLVLASAVLILFGPVIVRWLTGGFSGS